MSESKVSIVALLGSARPDNFTSKALAVTLDEIARNPKYRVEVIDPNDYDLGLPGHSKPAVMQAIQDKVRTATGVVLATPEYHGSYSSVIKLLIEHLGFPSVLATKPTAIVGVAAGTIGAIKATEHLRSVAAHVGAIVLPGAVSVASVNRAFNAEGEIVDASAEKRLRAAGTGLIHYIEDNICPRMALEQMVRSDD